jgi:hypothetical protein
MVCASRSSGHPFRLCVCHCVIHSNAELMLEAIKISRNRASELISMIVCDRENRDCMLRECKECPSPNSDLRKYLEDHLANFESDQVAFSMWMSTARTVMMSTVNHATEWVEVSRDRQPEPACSALMASNY